jgi:hypothetical protein
MPICKHDTISQIHFDDTNTSKAIYRARRMQGLGNWSMCKEIDGCPILCNISLLSLVTISNSNLICMSHQKANATRNANVHIHIL